MKGAMCPKVLVYQNLPAFVAFKIYFYYKTPNSGDKCNIFVLAKVWESATC